MPTAEQWRVRVLEDLDQHADQMVAELADLVRIPSISGSDEENEIMPGLSGTLARAGLEMDHWQIPLDATLAAADFPGVEVARSEAWGLVGRLPGRGDGPSLMFNTHVDVVPAGDRGHWAGADPFDGAIDGVGGRTVVRGRGACDMKGGLVSAHWAVRALAAVGVPLRGDLLVACVQGEEDGGLGTYATLARGWRADACVIPEPTSLDLAPASGGSLTFRLRVPGAATHASRRTAGVSAIEKFLPVFRGLRELEASRNRDPDPLMARWDIAYPIEVGVVHSGVWSSSVPDELVAEGRYGVALGEPAERARAEFETAISEVCAADPWLADHPVSVQWWGGQFESGATPSDSPIAELVRTAHALVAGTPQQIWGTPYGSDLRLMTNLGGVPTVHYGPGDAALAHGPGEYVPVDEVLAVARTLAVVALEHCGVL